MATVLDRLGKWFLLHCDCEREHDYGISIQSCDNPGWWVKIDLRQTELCHREFVPVRRGELNNDPQPPWLHCYVEDDVFNGAGDPGTLEEILTIFLKWAEDD
ncbi:MAG: rhodanese-related sulfurtransferase [Thermoanaerobaculia bacterium]|nr:rhodanese-related sulfurtransferase [Thermoanaerobaculia bacterium]